MRQGARAPCMRRALTYTPPHPPRLSCREAFAAGPFPNSTVPTVTHYSQTRCLFTPTSAARRSQTAEVATLHRKTCQPLATGSCTAAFAAGPFPNTTVPTVSHYSQNRCLFTPTSAARRSHTAEVAALHRMTCQPPATAPAPLPSRLALSRTLQSLTTVEIGAYSRRPRLPLHRIPSPLCIGFPPSPRLHIAPEKC